MTETAATSRDARLARWAASALAGSLVLVVVALATIVAVSDLPTLLREHPLGTASAALLLGCYIASFVCLNKIQKGSARSDDLLWTVSFLSAAAPLIALIHWLGPMVGSIVGLPEIIALVIHVVALADV